MSTIGQLFRSLFTKDNESERYQWKADSEGITFFISQNTSEKIISGQADIWVSHQHLILSMLAEQGNSEVIPNGFIVPTSSIVNLDDASREALELPEQWQGHMRGAFKGQTFKTSFSMNLQLSTDNNQYTGIYELKGPLLVLDDVEYLQTPSQALIFSALQLHKVSGHSEADNLRLVMTLQEAQKSGANLSVSVFDNMELKTPARVTVSAEIDNEGNLILTPNLGQQATHEQMQSVLNQLRNKDDCVIRVGEEIILLDEISLKAVHEILKNRIVPKDKIEQFYQTPSAFIDASLIELDVGFSARVKGAAYFTHAYFGETDASGLNWFGASEGKRPLLPISQLINYVSDSEDIKDFEQRWVDSKLTSSQTLEFKEKLFDTSDSKSVEKVIEQVKEMLESGDLPDVDDPEVSTGTPESGPPTDDEPPPNTSEPTEPEPTEPGSQNPSQAIVIDPEGNDDDVDFDVSEEIVEISYPKEQLDWSGYPRKPYPHQEGGVAWIVGLAMEGVRKEKTHWGGLLADDMGLGKTFMALSAIEHLYKIKDENKPCLIVAPLSVLENWKDEVSLTFADSPFNDIVILQSASDMKKYRIGGKETKQDFSTIETDQELPDQGELARIRYSLKVGEEYTFDERLDQPKRLVITTYQTLRDYQFSLCKVHWSMVVFDEAQNIKNPNAMQTRAAKGLNSEFNLLVTGTPVENSLADFWCLMDTVVPGHLGSYQEFREKYILPIIQSANDEIYEERIRVGRQLRHDTGVFMLRRVKEDNLKGLPNKIIHVGADSEESEWVFDERLYSTMKGSQKANYEAIITANSESESNEALANLHRLRDVSLHPYLVDKGRLAASPKANVAEIKSTLVESAKLESLLHVIESIRTKQEKCIIFCINKQLQQFLSLALGSLYGLGVLSVINGDTKTVNKRDTEKTRKGMIAAFETKEGFNLIIMSPIAAGVGLTVVGANHAIHLERHWNPAKEAQASDRIYRIGQTRDAHIYVPILHHPNSDSFDVNLHKLLSKKTLLKDAVVTIEQILPEMPDRKTDVNKRLTGADLNKISWQQFEALCAELFLKELSATGCWLTNPGKDKGADVALVTPNGASLIQCKHTHNNTYSGYSAIQEVKAAEPIYSELLGQTVHRLLFVTNAQRVSSEAKRVAMTSGVEIITRTNISSLLEKHPVKLSAIFKRLDKPRLVGA